MIIENLFQYSHINNHSNIIKGIKDLSIQDIGYIITESFVEEELSKPETTNDLKKYTSLNKEYKTLGKIVKKHKEYSSTITGIEEAKKIIETEKDLEFKEIPKKELQN